MVSLGGETRLASPNAPTGNFFHGVCPLENLHGRGATSVRPLLLLLRNDCVGDSKCKLGEAWKN